MVGLEDGNPISVSTYPAAWRIEVVNDDIYRGFEYVRSGHHFTRSADQHIDTTPQLLLGNYEEDLEHTRWY